MPSLFKYNEVVDNIWEESTRLFIQKNYGNKQVKQIDNVPDFGEVWFDPSAIEKIYGLSDMVKGVTM